MIGYSNSMKYLSQNIYKERLIIESYLIKDPAAQT